MIQLNALPMPPAVASASSTPSNATSVTDGAAVPSPLNAVPEVDLGVDAFVDALPSNAVELASPVTNPVTVAIDSTFEPPPPALSASAPLPMVPPGTAIPPLRTPDRLEATHNFVAKLHTQLGGKPPIHSTPPTRVPEPPLKPPTKVGPPIHVPEPPVKVTPPKTTPPKTTPAPTPGTLPGFQIPAGLSGVDALAYAGDQLTSEEDGLESQIAAMAGSTDPASQAKLMELQTKLQQLEQMITTITNMLSDDNDVKRSIISNLKA